MPCPRERARPCSRVPFLLLALLTTSMMPPSASAHACYALANASTGACEATGADPALLARGLTASPLVPLALAGLIIAPVGVHGLRRFGHARAGPALSRAGEAAAAYARDHVPFLLRLGLGTGLVASGLTDAFVTPLAPQKSGLAFAFAGGLVIAGAGTRWIALGIIGWFVGALPGAPALLMNTEAVAIAALLAFVLPAGAPSVDEWWARVSGRASRGVDARALDRTALALRAGLAVALLAGALAEKLLNPARTAAVVEMHGLAGVLGVPAEGWVVLMGAAEIALALALLVGFETRASALTVILATVLMAALTRENPAWHAGLIASAVALALMGSRAFTLRVSARFVRRADEDAATP